MSREFSTHTETERFPDGDSAFAVHSTALVEPSPGAPELVGVFGNGLFGSAEAADGLGRALVREAGRCGIALTMITYDDPPSRYQSSYTERLVAATTAMVPEGDATLLGYSRGTPSMVEGADELLARGHRHFLGITPAGITDFMDGRNYHDNRLYEAGAIAYHLGKDGLKLPSTLSDPGSLATLWTLGGNIARHAFKLRAGMVDEVQEILTTNVTDETVALQGRSGATIIMAGGNNDGIFPYAEMHQKLVAAGFDEAAITELDTNHTGVLTNRKLAQPIFAEIARLNDIALESVAEVA